MNVVNTRISQRYDTLQNWTQRNPTLLEGELAVVATDNQTRFKIGDGQHAFNELNFIDQLKLTTVSAFANILSVNNAAIGFQNSVGTHSLAAGTDTSANGQHAIALGYKAAASSNGAFVFNGDQSYLAQPYYDHGAGTFNVNAPLSNMYIEDSDIKTALSDEGFVLSTAIPTDLSDLTNSPGYTTNAGTITGITMNGVSKGTSGNVNLGTVLTAHQSLSNCLQNNSSYDSINLTATGGIRLASDVRIDNGYGFTVKEDTYDSYTTVNLTGISVKEQIAGEIDDQTNIGAAYITMSTLRPRQLPPSELFKSIIFTTKTYNTSQTSSLANLIYTKSETSSATEISNAINQKSTVSFNQITTTGTNIGSITIDGTTTQIYAPTGGSGGGSSVQVSADYQTGTRVATISVDNVPTSIYVPNSAGGSSRYALETAQLVADGGSLTCAVNDQAITTIQVSSSSTPVVVQLPAQPEDGARDFILRIEISSSAAPTFAFNGVSETIDFDSEDDDWAVMEPGLNLVSFTETKRGTNSEGSTSTYCTVTFDIENGKNASRANATFVNPSDATRQVEAGQPVGTLPTPNLASQYTFLGWWTATSSSAGQQVTDQTVITNDTTFYAIFIHAGADN